MNVYPNRFEQLHRAEEGAIFRFILDRVNDYETAQDSTVETFVQAYRSWDAYQANATLSSREWIYRLAEESCSNWEQRKQ
jgi:DNA-directed RNA polymerase specialized sigma24 family protein